MRYYFCTFCSAPSKVFSASPLLFGIVDWVLYSPCPCLGTLGPLQVAYRPKTNSYDAFTVAQMQQEITDLALFGTNGIEVIPPALDDAAQSPHFTVPWLQMLTATSRWCDNLDLNVSIWYPAFFRSYDGDGATAARAHWDSVFAALPRLDVLFIPGGDPGGRPAANFFPIAEVHAEHYRRHFPRGEVWISSQ